MRLKPVQKVNFLLIIFLLSLFPATSFAFIKSKGGKFVNAKGREVFFKGIGLGGWLVPEGYMLHMPGFGSPTSINQQIVDLIGPNNGKIFWKNYRKQYVTQKDIEQIAAWGFNSIRLPFNYRLISPEDQPGTYLEEGFAVIDSLIRWCKINKLYLILDMHCAPGGQNADNISDSDGTEARLWTESENQDRTVDIWQKIAERYANDTTIVGYDLLNEPVLPSGYPATDLRNLYMRITHAIRQVDTNHVVFIEGNWYATDFSALTPPWDANLAYSFHKYWSETSSSTIQDYLNIRKTYGTPLWMGESGENSNHWFASVVKLLQDNAVSWCWWTHKKFETTTSPLSARLPNGFQTLVNYWNGQGSKPSESYALSILLQMTENLKLDKCDFRPDVLQALLSRQFLTQNSPFRLQEIPGKIVCVDYDFGGNDVAYFDVDYQKTRWDAQMPWNSGGQYRNDGVDIEASHDELGAEYSVGWIEAGEWIKFTVNVKASGTYNLILRFASAQGNGQLQILINGTPLTKVIEVYQTGGWYNWDTITIKDLPLLKGEQELTLKFLQAGFNINQLEFVKMSSIEQPGVSPLKFELGQNYPNPFNQSTKIPFYVSTNSNVKLEVFDLNGQRVFWAIKKAQGQDDFIWLANTSPNGPVSSGLYFYRVQAGKQSKTRKMLLLR